MHQYARPPKRKKNQRPKHLLFWVLAGALVVSGLFTVYLLFSTLIDMAPFFHRENKPDEPEVAEVIPQEEIEPEVEQEFEDLNAPLQGKNGPRPQSWDGESRLNILVLGVDDRIEEPNDGPPRTDTMILLTIDPQSETAGMLSLPRDLWLEIPGQGGDHYKINQAYTLGEANNLPGGGAGLAMQTVEQFLDISIPYYAQVNFHTFVQLVNEVNGVKINVPEKIMVDLRYGNVKHLQPGVQTLPGDIALAYVRARNTPGGDFDRGQRQQQVLRGLLARVTDFDMIPTLIKRSPIIYQDMKDGVNTNLTPGQIFKLSQLVYSIRSENLTSLAINQTHATAGFSWNGMYILTPIPEQIAQLKYQLFSTVPSPVAAIPTATVINTPTDEPEQATAETIAQENQDTSTEVDATQDLQPVIDAPTEAATIGIHNGTSQSGLASETAAYFEINHLEVTIIDNADSQYPYTTIIDYSGKPNTLTALSKLLDLPTLKLYNQFNPDSKYDILVILGNDWAEDNPLPQP
jgi:polyisoprenyl-teichoic acid--peptidoglycan teichoic acid transferase